MEFTGFNNKTETKIFEKGEVLDMLYNTLPSVSKVWGERGLKETKYSNLAIKNNLENYRVCTLHDIHSLKLMKSFTDNQREFLNDNGEFLVMFNTVGGKPVSLVMRSLKEKKFVDFSLFYTLYGLDLIDDAFRYGDWLLLTEGIFDSDSFRTIFKNSVAMLTSSITLMQAEVLNTLTDKFIIAFDNDLGGTQGYAKSCSRLKSINPKCVIKKLSLYNDDNDLGVLGEFLDDSEFTIRKIFYTAHIDKLTRGWL